MNVIDQIYNGAALLEEHYAKSRKNADIRHKLRIASFRINAFLNNLQPLRGDTQAQAAEAYMAGYEDESK